MNDEILVALGRYFIDTTVRQEMMMREIQALQAKVKELTKPPEGATE